MGEVISFDFKEKKKIEKYVITPWKCLVCRTAFKYDSRDGEKNMPRIILREGSLKRAEESICKECSLDIKATAEEQQWKYDEVVKDGKD